MRELILESILYNYEEDDENTMNTLMPITLNLLMFSKKHRFVS